MAWYIALLRGVNVGGNSKVSMAELAGCIEALGYERVKTLLNSGNVVFTGPKRTAAQVEEQLEKEIAGKLDLKADVMVRTPSDLEEVLAANPFPEFAADNPSKFLVMFLKDKPTAAAVKELEASIPGEEKLEVVGRHVFVCYPQGMGRSKLAVEPRLKVRGTGRSWNTVQKLAAAAGD